MILPAETAPPLPPEEELDELELLELEPVPEPPELTLELLPQAARLDSNRNTKASWTDRRRTFVDCFITLPPIALAQTPGTQIAGRKCPAYSRFWIL